MTTIKATRNDEDRTQTSSNSRGYVTMNQYGHIYVEQKKIDGVDIAANSGNLSASTQRVCIATDDVNSKRLTDKYYFDYDYHNWVPINGLDLDKYSNSLIYWNNIITVSGSYTAGSLKQYSSFSLSASSEIVIQPRYVMPVNKYPQRWDFNVCFADTGTDTTSYMLFGLRMRPELAQTNASTVALVGVKLWNKTSGNATAGFVRTNISPVSSPTMDSLAANCNISNTFPSNICKLNKWSIFLYEGAVAIIGWWDPIRHNFIPVASFYDIGVGFTGLSNGAFMETSIYKPFVHIYNASTSSYSSMLVNWTYYLPKNTLNIDNCLSLYKVFTTGFVTHTYTGTTYEALAWIQYTASTIHSYFLHPVMIVFKCYASSGTSAVQLCYVSDNSNTTSSPLTFHSTIVQQNRSVTTTNGIIPLQSIYVPTLSSSQINLPNAYRYMGINDASSSYPCIYIQGKAANTNTIEFSMDIYFI